MDDRALPHSTRIQRRRRTPTRTQPVCIAGMHRSGTSMVAQVLRICGLDLGNEADLLPPSESNPEGHWEHIRLVSINDELLNALGGGWDLPPAFPQVVSNDDEPYRSLAVKARAIQKECFSQALWGWKDPRNSLTLPFWQSLWPNLKTVICLRNPLEVALSLRRRGASSYEFGLSLWAAYNRLLLSATQPKRRIVTHYDAYFADPQKEIRRLTRFLDLPVSEHCLEASFTAVKSQHHHNLFTTRDLLDAGISSDVLQLYLSLCAEAKWSGAESRLAAAGQPALMANANVGRQVDTSQLEVELARREARALRLDRDETAEQLRVALSESEEWRHETQVLRLQRDQWNGEAIRAAIQEQFDARYRDLGEMRVTLQQQIDARGQALEAQLATAQQQIDARGQTLEAQLTAAQQQIDARGQALEAQLATAQQQIDARGQTLEAQLTAAQQQIDARGQALEAQLTMLQQQIDARGQALEAQLAMLQQQIDASGQALEVLRTNLQQEDYPLWADELLRTIASQDQRLEVISSGVEVARNLWEEAQRKNLIQQVRNAVCETVPAAATVIVVTKGDPALLKLNGRIGWHFPQQEDGTYAGYYPADSGEAITALEKLRNRGAHFIAIPRPAFWWLEHYSGFRRHLEDNYVLMEKDNELCIVFDLRVRPPNPGSDGRAR